MTERELMREVATATGESVRTISNHGFVLLRPVAYERDREPLVVDWDEVDARRLAQQPL